MPDHPDQIPAKALLIDLDDTLYDEGDYVRSGFRVVAARLSLLFPGASEARIYQGMLTELNANGRGMVFDRALEQIGQSPEPDLVASLVDVYRGHQPKIGLWPGVAETLRSLRRSFRLAIVTDGTEVMQRRKVQALGVEGLVHQVAYCWGLGAPKPSPEAYYAALRNLGVRPDEAVVIGDNPAHDMAAALAIPCPSIRIRTGKYARQDSAEYPADLDLPDFPAIAPHLVSMQTGVRS